MEPTKENIALLKKLGFTKDTYLEGESYSLPNGWGFFLNSIKDFPTLMERLYVGKAETIINNGDDFEYGGWTLIPFEKSEYEEFEKIVENHKISKRLEKLKLDQKALEKEAAKLKKTLNKKCSYKK